MDDWVNLYYYSNYTDVGETLRETLTFLLLLKAVSDNRYLYRNDTEYNCTTIDQRLSIYHQVPHKNNTKEWERHGSKSY